MTSENVCSAKPDYDRLSRLRKLKTLAERGSPGEKENAALLLSKMCEKYQIAPDQIESSDEIKAYWFKFRRGGPYRGLLAQCIYKTLGMPFDSYRRGKGKTGSTAELGVECTTAEAMEIELDYSFFSTHLEREITVLADMFIQKNDIFPKNCPKKSPGECKITAEEIAIYSALKKHTRTLMIDGPKTSAIQGGES